MLTVADLAVNYGSIAALRGISLEVGAGELVGVVGPNGAGKSTLLKAIAGAVDVADGSIEFGGVSILGKSPEHIVRLGVSLVPEGRRIFTKLSVAENLQIGATVRPDRDAAAADLEMVFELFPILKDYFRTQAGKLSGGEQQMLAIGRALLTDPKLLLLDEPSLGLAPIVVDRVFETLEILQERRVTILLVEQNAARTIELSDRVYILRSGVVEFAGAAEDLARDQLYERTLFGSG